MSANLAEQTIENHSELWKDSSLEAGFVQRLVRTMPEAEMWCMILYYSRVYWAVLWPLRSARGLCSYARLQEAAERRADSLKQRDDGGGPMRMLSIEAAETSIMVLHCIAADVMTLLTLTPWYLLGRCMCNPQGIFTPYQVEAKEYLAREPWQRFLRR